MLAEADTAKAAPQPAPTPAPQPAEPPAPAPEKAGKSPVKAAKGGKQAQQPQGSQRQLEETEDLAAVRAAIRAIVAENSDEDDWLSVSTIGNMLVKRQPDFDVRNFGFSKLTQFIQALGMFEVRIVRKKDNTRQAYVREK